MRLYYYIDPLNGIEAVVISDNRNRADSVANNFHPGMEMRTSSILFNPAGKAHLMPLNQALQPRKSPGNQNDPPT